MCEMPLEQQLQRVGPQCFLVLTTQSGEERQQNTNSRLLMLGLH